MTPDTPLDGARWLLAHGFAVFPTDHPGTAQCTGIGRGHDPAVCTDRGKHPCVPFTRGFLTAPEQLQRIFGEQLRNVAVAVGECHGSDGARLIVVDSDRPGAIEDTADGYGQPHTPTMRVTTAKGHHDYYWLPAGVRLGNGLGELRGRFDGDVRAGNAYVIGPGSLHATGVVYTLTDPGRPPVPIPAWLLDALQRPAARPASVPAQHRGASGGRRSTALTGLVKFVLEAPQGERNSRLYWAACRAFERARQGQVDQRAVASALVDAASHIGLSEAEARSTVTSAYRSTGGNR